MIKVKVYATAPSRGVRVAFLFGTLLGVASGQYSAVQKQQPITKKSAQKISLEKPPADSGSAVFQLVPTVIVNRTTKQLPLTPFPGSVWDLCPSEMLLEGKPAQTTGSACTAFLYKKEGGSVAFFVTAGHCLHDLIGVFDSRQYTPGSLSLAQGGKAQFTIDEVGFLPGEDIAFLTVRSKVDQTPLTFTEPPSCPSPTPTRNPTQSNPTQPSCLPRAIHGLHHPLGTEILIKASGSYEGGESVKMATLAGSSGAPLFTADGKVFGVVIEGQRALSPSTLVSGIPSGYCNIVDAPTETTFVSTTRINDRLDEIGRNQRADEQGMNAVKGRKGGKK